MYGLDTYIQSKPLEERMIITSSGASLLHYAIPRAAQRSHVVSPQSSTIKLLLQTCDVNGNYKLQSPWQQALKYAQNQLARGISLSAEIEIVKILTLIVQSGANIRVHSQAGFGKYNVHDFLREIKSMASMDADLAQATTELTEEVQSALGQGKLQAGNRGVVIAEGSDSKHSKTERLKAWLKK